MDDSDSPRPRRRRSEEEDDPRRRAEEDEPRARRRRDEEDEDEEVPRRPRRRRVDEDEDEDEDVPRRPRSREELTDEALRRRIRKPNLSGKPMSTRTKVIIWSVVIGAVLIGLGTWWIVYTVRRAPFRKHMSAYLATPTGAPGMGPGGVGKMVVVDVKDKDVDSLHFDLPDDLKAATPEEVVTVVRLMWDKRRVGEYQGGGGAYQWYCDLSIYDLRSKTILASQSFVGTPPPQSFTGKRGESRSGDKPTNDIIAFLKRLPRLSAPPPAAQQPQAGNPPAPVIAPFEVDPALNRPEARINLALMTPFDVVNGPWPVRIGNLGDPARSPFRLKGVRAPWGLSMRPGADTGARARYALGGRCRIFAADVGLADGPEVSRGVVTFEVLGDGKSLWRSQPVRARGVVQHCSVSVVGVKILELRTSVEGSDEGAYAVWISEHVEK